MSPMERTLKLFRSRGYEIGVVEKFVFGAGIRRDLFGIIDAIAIRVGEIVGVQVCGQDFAPHVRKITVEGAKAALGWLRAGGGLVLVGWRPLKRRKGPFRAKFEAREQWFTVGDFKEDTKWLD